MFTRSENIKTILTFTIPDMTAFVEEFAGKMVTEAGIDIAKHQQHYDEFIRELVTVFTNDTITKIYKPISDDDLAAYATWLRSAIPSVIKTHRICNRNAMGMIEEVAGLAVAAAERFIARIKQPLPDSVSMQKSPPC